MKFIKYYLLDQSKAFLFCLSVVLIGYLSACESSDLALEGTSEVVNDSTNDLRMSVKFKLTEKAAAYIKFWPESNSKKIFYSQLSSANILHNIILIGLKGATTYKYQIIAENEEHSTKGEISSFTTMPFPINILHLRWQEDLNKGLDGYILSQRRMVNGIIYLIDEDGDVVWYNQIPKQPKLSHWTKNNSILVLYGAAKHRNSAGDHIVEYDLYGNELFHIYLSEANTPVEAHHEVRYTANGDILSLIYHSKKFDLSEIGGEVEQEVLGDKIVRMDKTGKILWEWSVFDYLNPLVDSTIVKMAKDWSHANSLSIDKDGNYLISFRNFNQVWKVNATSGEVMWKLGQNGDISMAENGYFSGQHAFHINRNGAYMIFDNGRENRQTRVLTYKIDEDSKTAEVGLDINLSEELYSDKMGSAYVMDNDNILICAPRTNSIVVIDNNGTIMAHAKVGIPDPYRAEYVPSLYNLDHVKE